MKGKYAMDDIFMMPSPVGELTLSSDGQNLTGLWLEGQKYHGATLDKLTQGHMLPVFELTKKWLDIYFSGKQPDFSVPLAPKGSEFRQAVWNKLCEIPYGSVVTYGSIAKQINNSRSGHKTSARAIGGAVGHNPISILIPCHRVIGVNGNLTGYAGGINRKIQLLELERVPMENLHIPSI